MMIQAAYLDQDNADRQIHISPPLLPGVVSHIEFRVVRHELNQARAVVHGGAPLHVVIPTHIRPCGELGGEQLEVDGFDIDLGLELEHVHLGERDELVGDSIVIVT